MAAKRQQASSRSLTHRDSAAAACAEPVPRVEVRPLALERSEASRLVVEEREPGDVDAAVTEIVQFQLVHRLHAYSPTSVQFF